MVLMVLNLSPGYIRNILNDSGLYPQGLSSGDLEDIWLYTRREWGVDQADSYLQRYFQDLTG